MKELDPFVFLVVFMEIMQAELYGANYLAY